MNDSGEVTFSWTGSESGESYACRLDGAAEQPCDSPDVLTGVADGLHDLTITPVDALSNRGTSTTVHWQQETPPTATILAEPPASTTSRNASFTYTSNKSASPVDGDTVSYLCRLDGGSFHSCPSAGSSFTGLSTGKHTFAVEADYHASLEPAGTSTVSQPASYTWTVKPAAKPACTLTADPKARAGKVALTGRCTQTLVATISGQATVAAGPHGRPARRTVHLKAVTVHFRAGRATAVKLSLGAAWKQLRAGRHVTAVFHLTGHNADGTVRVTSRSVTLRR